MSWCCTGCDRIVLNDIAFAVATEKQREKKERDECDHIKF